MPNVSDLVGLPYKVHGRDESGLDCFGLIWLIAFRNGTPIGDPVYKGFDPSLVTLADQIGLVKCDFAPGCVIEMIKDKRLHLGYALDKERMIHATHNEGVIIEKIGSYEVRGYYKFRGKI